MMVPSTEHGGGGGTSGSMAVTKETRRVSLSEETAVFGKLKLFHGCDWRKLHQSDFGSSLKTPTLKWCWD